MSKVQNHSKVAHPNRLVNKHEEYLINKSLANKVRHVKSSIPAENQTFERVLITRQKRETQRSSHNKLRHPDSHDELEGDHNEHYEHNREEANFQEFYTKDFYGKAADTLPIRTAGSSSRGGQDNHLLMAKSGPVQFVSSPRSIIERNGYGKLATHGSTASYRKESRGASPEKADVIAEKIAEKNREVEMLKSKLVEKSHEIESLKSDLKGKWQEDFGQSPSKENQVQNGQARGLKTTINKDISAKTLKPVNMGKSSVVGMERPNSEARLKKQLSLGSEQKKMNEFVSRQHVQYEESLKILERFEEIERSKKKLEPIKKDAVVKKELPERPASVKNKTKPNNDKFKIRFSNHLEHGMLKANTRYKSDGVEVIDEMTEQEREETLGESVEEKLEIKEPKIPVAQKRKNNRYQQAEADDDELTQAESPQIEVISKTLMLQSKVISSRNNEHGFRHVGLTDSEVLIE